MEKTAVELIFDRESKVAGFLGEPVLQNVKINVLFTSLALRNQEGLQKFYYLGLTSHIFN